MSITPQQALQALRDHFSHKTTRFFPAHEALNILDAALREEAMGHETPRDGRFPAPAAGIAPAPPKGTTTDPTDPRLGRGEDSAPREQNEVYLVLSPEERAKGFVRPLRRAYIHKGERPQHPTRALTAEQEREHAGRGYVLYEKYPEGGGIVGRFWTQEQLDSGCGAKTTMSLDLCETYARKPDFYGSTYCTGCRMHKRVEEFVWVEDGQRVGS